MAIEKPNFYAVIPADVRYDEHLTPNAKLLYAEISSLIGKEGFCYASNAYFLEVFGFSEKTTSRLIATLETYGYVKRVISRDKTGKVDMRKIYLTASLPCVHPPVNFEGTSPPKKGDPPDKIDGCTNTSITNVEKENKKEKAVVSKSRTAMDGEQLTAACVEWISQAGLAWPKERKNDLYLALVGFYAPRESKKQAPSQTKAAFTALTNRLMRYSSGDPAVMVDMLERATGAGWKSVYPLREAAAAEAPARREDELWL